MFGRRYSMFEVQYSIHVRDSIIRYSGFDTWYSMIGTRFPMFYIQSIFGIWYWIFNSRDLILDIGHSIFGIRDSAYNIRLDISKLVCDFQHSLHHVLSFDLNIMNSRTRTTLLCLSSIWLGWQCTLQSPPSFHGCPLVAPQPMSGGILSSTSVPAVLDPRFHPPAREERDHHPQRQTGKD